MLLLHDVFGYPFDQIGGMVGQSTESCRQIASRTRRKLQGEPHELRRPRAAREQELVGALLATVVRGDIAEVMALLAPDIVMLSDGGAGPPVRHDARWSAPTASPASW